MIFFCRNFIRDFVLIFCLSVFMTATAQKKNKRPCHHERIRSLILSPPEGWNINAMTRKDVRDFVCNRALVNAAITCLEDSGHEDCTEVTGLNFLVRKSILKKEVNGSTLSFYDHVCEID